MIRRPKKKRAGLKRAAPPPPMPSLPPASALACMRLVLVLALPLAGLVIAAISWGEPPLLLLQEQQEQQKILDSGNPHAAPKRLRTPWWTSLLARQKLRQLWSRDPDAAEEDVEDLDMLDPEEWDWEDEAFLRRQKNVCKRRTDPQLLPRYALSKTEKKAEVEWSKARDKLDVDLRNVLEVRNSTRQPLQVCIHTDHYIKYVQLTEAMKEYYMNQGAIVRHIYNRLFRDKTNDEDLLLCDVELIWAIKGSGFIFSRRKLTLFPHFLLLEEPWFWREDPVDPNRTWAFVAWDNLNGYSLDWGQPRPDDRWKRFFADHIPIRPWIGPRPEGYVLLLGQVPSDISVLAQRKKRHTDLYGVYGEMVAAIKANLPSMEIVYRPHPRLYDPSIKCKMPPLQGVTERKHTEESLDQALEGAAIVVAVSSTSVIEAVFRGIPAITVDSISPTYPVSCHDFSSLADAVINGTACRPDRTQWLADLGYAMWNIDDIRAGNVHRFLFQLGGDMLADAPPQGWSYGSLSPAESRNRSRPAVESGSEG